MPPHSRPGKFERQEITGTERPRLRQCSSADTCTVSCGPCMLTCCLTCTGQDSNTAHLAGMGFKAAHTPLHQELMENLLPQAESCYSLAREYHAPVAGVLPSCRLVPLGKAEVQRLHFTHTGLGSPRGAALHPSLLRTPSSQAQQECKFASGPFFMVESPP